MRTIFSRKRAWIPFCVGLGFLLSIVIFITQFSAFEKDIPLPTTVSSGHKLAILVPFRDRFEELLEFAPHMCTFLSNQGLDFHIFVINQVDKYRFNRASLINVGYLESSDYDYLAMHDVDLLPMNGKLSYGYPVDGPFHVSAPNLHPKYHYNKFLGGILLLTRSHFAQAKGLSNKFWGWGQEDDEFRLRLLEAGLTVNQPKNIDTGLSTFKHIHNDKRRPRDYRRCPQQKENIRRDRITGVHDVSYEIMNRHSLHFGNAKGCSATVLNVKIHCDVENTPWCQYC